MAGGRHRPVRSLYQAGEEAKGSDVRRRRNPRSRRPPARLQVSEEAEPVTPVERAHEEEEEEAPFDEQEALAGGTGSSSSARSREPPCFSASSPPPSDSP